MVAVDKAVIARLSSHGQHFEILVDCDNALLVKEGKDLDMKDVLAAEKIFTDAKKGDEAAEAALNQVFESSDPIEIAKAIIKKGEVQLTSEHRQKVRDQKERQIINIIHRNGVDPKNHTPHPITRIENALAEAKFHVDEYESVERQVQNALKKIKPILPIKFEVKEIKVKIGPEFAGKAYSSLKSLATILKEEWQNDGYFVAVVEMPGGLESEFYDKLNSVCHGEVEVEVIKTK